MGLDPSHCRGMSAHAEVPSGAGTSLIWCCSASAGSFSSTQYTSASLNATPSGLAVAASVAGGMEASEHLPQKPSQPSLPHWRPSQRGTHLAGTHLLLTAEHWKPWLQPLPH